jgi:hypothetical protein
MSLATIYRDTLNAEQRRSRADQFGRCGQRPAAIDLLPAIGSLLGRVFRASLATTGLRDIFGQPGHACQTTETWRIREREILARNQPALPTPLRREWTANLQLRVLQIVTISGALSGRAARFLM